MHAAARRFKVIHRRAVDANGAIPGGAARASVSSGCQPERLEASLLQTEPSLVHAGILTGEITINDSSPMRGRPQVVVAASNRRVGCYRDE